MEQKILIIGGEETIVSREYWDAVNFMVNYNPSISVEFESLIEEEFLIGEMEKAFLNSETNNKKLEYHHKPFNKSFIKNSNVKSFNQKIYKTKFHIHRGEK